MPSDHAVRKVSRKPLHRDVNDLCKTNTTQPSRPTAKAGAVGVEELLLRGEDQLLRFQAKGAQAKDKNIPPQSE